MLEGLQPIVGNSLKVKPAKGSSSPSSAGCIMNTGGYDSCKFSYLGVTFFDIFSLACFNYGDFYFQFQLTVLFWTGQLVIAFSSCEHMEL